MSSGITRIVQSQSATVFVRDVSLNIFLCCTTMHLCIWSSARNAPVECCLLLRYPWWGLLLVRFLSSTLAILLFCCKISVWCVLRAGCSLSSWRPVVVVSCLWSAWLKQLLRSCNNNSRSIGFISRCSISRGRPSQRLMLFTFCQLLLRLLW